MSEILTPWEGCISPSDTMEANEIQLILDPDTVQPTLIGHERTWVLTAEGWHVITSVQDSNRLEVKTILHCNYDA